MKIQPDFPDTVRRLNYLVDRLGVTKYLEVGLGNGGTFDNVNAREKVGVDPHPWNGVLREFPGVQIMTSDAYFSRNWDAGIKFDLILLDGLHTAEQTYRDFVNSLHFAHDKTVWLFDDVVPSDEYSAIPDQTEAVKRRKAKTGSDDRAWHGDVFKVVWMVNTFHPNMTVRTFWPQQPQSLVYSSGANDRPASKMTIGDIANLNFKDTVARRADYRVGDEIEILDQCVAALKSR